MKDNALARQILLIHSDRFILDEIAGRALKDGYLTLAAESVSEAALILSQQSVDTIICENSVLKKSGGDFLEWVHDRMPLAVVVILSSLSDFEMAIEGLEQALDLDPSEDDSESLERRTPGITRLQTDSKGFLILGD